MFDGSETDFLSYFYGVFVYFCKPKWNEYPFDIPLFKPFDI